MNRDSQQDKTAKLKKWKCAACNTAIEVEEDYQFEYCCSGNACGCYGKPINPAFCDECEKKLFAPPIKDEGKCLFCIEE